MKRTVLISSLIATAAILAACSTDQQSRRGPGHRDGGNDAMRQAAVAACVNKAEGTRVTLTTPRGESFDATCTKSPRGNDLVAFPDKMLQAKQVMIDACVGKKEGDSVTLTSPRDNTKTIGATCKKRGDQMMADVERPRDARKGPDGRGGPQKSPKQAPQ